MASGSSEARRDSTVSLIFAMCAEKEGEEGGGVSRTKERSHLVFSTCLHLGRGLVILWKTVAICDKSESPAGMSWSASAVSTKSLALWHQVAK